MAPAPATERVLETDVGRGTTKAPMSRLISADSHVAISLDKIRERVPSRPARGVRRRDRRAGAASTTSCAAAASSPSTTSTWTRSAIPAITIRSLASRRWTATASTPRSSTPRSAPSAPSVSSRATGGRSAGPSPTISASSPRSIRSASCVSYQVPIIDVDYAVSEVHRLADLGARSVHLPNFPSEIRPPRLPRAAVRPAVGRAAGDRHLHQPPPRQPRLALRRLPARPHPAGRHLHLAAGAGAGRGRRVVDPHRHPRAVSRS